MYAYILVSTSTLNRSIPIVTSLKPLINKRKEKKRKNNASIIVPAWMWARWPCTDHGIPWCNVWFYASCAHQQSHKWVSQDPWTLFTSECMNHHTLVKLWSQAQYYSIYSSKKMCRFEQTNMEGGNSNFLRFTFCTYIHIIFYTWAMKHINYGIVYSAHIPLKT
jgi:hypothetical protein